MFCFYYICPTSMFHFPINITSMIKSCQLFYNNVFDINQFSRHTTNNNVKYSLIYVCTWAVSLFMYIFGSWHYSTISGSHLIENLWNVLVEKYYKPSLATPLVSSRATCKCIVEVSTLSLVLCVVLFFILFPQIYTKIMCQHDDYCKKSWKIPKG